MSKRYNTSDLDPEATFERHVFHRDQFAHFLRWTHVLKKALKTATIDDDDGVMRKRLGTVVDFGCGKGNLLEVLYRNRAAPRKYVGIDIRTQTINKANEKWTTARERGRDWTFVADDLIVPAVVDFDSLYGDFVVSFEVAEHVGRQNVPTFLENFKRCGAPGAQYFLSTPNFDPRVGAAGNHTYNSGRLLDDGTEAGVEVHELDHFDLQQMIMDAGFTIVEKFGTFASQRDYKDHLTPAQQEVYAQLNKYYDVNLIANIMAPIVDPSLARNCMWVLKADR